MLVGKSKRRRGSPGFASLGKRTARGRFDPAREVDEYLSQYEQKRLERERFWNDLRPEDRRREFEGE